MSLLRPVLKAVFEDIKMKFEDNSNEDEKESDWINLSLKYLKKKCCRQQNGLKSMKIPNLPLSEYLPEIPPVNFENFWQCYRTS
jgi:hypothetical protein